MKRLLSFIKCALYISKRDAIEVGMTHEGRLYGIPAWMRVDSDEEVSGTPKMPIFTVIWCKPLEFVLNAATYFMPEDRLMVFPVAVGKRIAGA